MRPGKTPDAQPLAVWIGGGYELAEGVRWTGDRLVFVDILAGTLLEASGAEHAGARVLARLDVPLGAVAPVAGGDGEWIAAAGTGIALLSRDGGLCWLARPEDRSPVPTRMNDGSCDPSGRFWAGSMAYDSVPGAGSLYRADIDGSVTRVLEGLTIPNGPAFNRDGSLMYLADSFAGIIHEYKLLPATGEIVGHRAFAEIPAAEGSPDGMAVDTANRLWVALWDGWAVRTYRPDGSIETVTAVPAPRPTSVCLGGPTGDRLFVTTARHGLEQPASESGAILSVRVAAAATPAAAFGSPAAR
jgi:sugar lactone lactonase YvrE